MPAAVKEFCSQPVAWETAYRTQGYLYHRLFRIFTQEAGENDIFNAQRYVYKPFAIATDIIEIALFLLSQRNQGGTMFRIDFHLRQHMPHKTQTAFGIGVVHFPVNLILVDTFRKQLTDYKINFTVIGVVRKATRIGHHTGIDTFSSLFGDVTEISHAANQAEHQLGSRGYFGMGNDDSAKVFRIQMVVYQYLPRRRSQHGVCHSIDTADSVEIEATDDIGFRYQFVGKLFITVVQKYILAAGHPFQEIGKSIGNNDSRILVLRIKKMPQPQRRAYCISVGSHMGNNNYFIRTFQPLGKVVYFRLIYYFGQHIVTRYFTVYVAYPEQLRLTCNKRNGKSTKKFMIYNNMCTEPFSERGR